MHVCTLTGVVAGVVRPVDALGDVWKHLVVLTHHCLHNLQRGQAGLRRFVTKAVIRGCHVHGLESLWVLIRAICRDHPLSDMHGVVGDSIGGVSGCLLPHIGKRLSQRQAANKISS